MSAARKAPEQGPQQGAQDETWWADALHALVRGESIRSVSRRFYTNPRRIRRALARTSVRANGQASHRGMPALAAVRDRIGYEPDGALAKVAGVIPEAIAGERRRLRIRPFRPTAKGGLTPDESEWIKGPERRGRIKAVPNEDVLVVHRVVRPELVGRDAVRASVIRRPTPPIPESDSPVPPPPEATASVFRFPRGVQTIRSQGLGAPVVLGRETGSPSEFARGFAPAPAHIRMRAEMQSERQREIDELLNAPRRDREGRQRLVRTDAGPMIEPEPPPAQSNPAARRRSDLPAWRVVPEAEPMPSAAVVEKAPVPTPVVEKAPAPTPVAAKAPVPMPVAEKAPTPVAAKAPVPSLVVEKAPTQRPVNAKQSQSTPIISAVAASPGREAYAPGSAGASARRRKDRPDVHEAPRAAVSPRAPATPARRAPEPAEPASIAGPLTRNAFLLLFPEDPYSIAFQASTLVAPPTQPSPPVPVPARVANGKARPVPVSAAPIQLSLGLTHAAPNLHFHVWCTLFGAPFDVHAPDVPSALAIAATLLEGLPAEITAVERA